MEALREQAKATGRYEVHPTEQRGSSGADLPPKGEGLNPERDNYMGFRHGRTPCREALRGQVPIEVPNEFQATYSTAMPWAAQHCPGIPALSGSKGRRRRRTDPVGRTQFKRRRDPALQYFAVTGDPQIQITSIRGPNGVSTG
jgi:hypothetical protein